MRDRGVSVPIRGGSLEEAMLTVKREGYAGVRQRDQRVTSPSREGMGFLGMPGRGLEGGRP